MTTESLFVSGREVVLARPIPANSRVAVNDIIYSANKKEEFYYLSIKGHSGKRGNPSHAGRKHVFKLILPVRGYTFAAFKEKLLLGVRDLLAPLALKATANRIINRFTARGNFLNFKKDLKIFWNIKLRLCDPLAQALGLPARTILVSPNADMIFSHFFENCSENTPQRYVYFPSRETAIIKCDQIDLSRHLDDSIYAFKLKTSTNNRRYTEMQNQFFFHLTPDNHRKLSFSWAPFLTVHLLTLTIYSPPLSGALT